MPRRPLIPRVRIDWKNRIVTLEIDADPRRIRELPDPTYLLTNELLYDDTTNGDLWKALESNPSPSADDTTSCKTGKTAAGNYFLFKINITDAAQYGTSFQESSGGKITGFRTNAITGSFATGTWTFNVKVVNRAAYAHAGRVVVKLYKSSTGSNTFADCTAVAGPFQGNIISFSATAGEVKTDTFTASVTGFSLSNQYLYFVYNWLITTAGGNANAGVKFRCDEASGESVQTTTLSVTTTRTIQQNATLKAVGQTQTLSQDARLKAAGQIQTVDQNAGLKAAGQTQTISQDAWIKTAVTTTTQTLDQNATLKTASTQLLQQDAGLKSTETKTIFQNATLKETSTKTLEQNAFIIEITSRTLLQDATLKETSAKTLSQEATLKTTLSQTIDQNAFLKAVETHDLLQDARIKGSVEQVVSQDAWIRLPYISSTQILSQDAAIKETVPREVPRVRRRLRWLRPVEYEYAVELPLIGWVANRYEVAFPITGAVASRYEETLTLQSQAANRFELTVPLIGAVSKQYEKLLELSGVARRKYKSVTKLFGNVAGRYEISLLLKGDVRKSYSAQFELIGRVRDAVEQFLLYKAILDLIENDEDQ